MLVVSVMSELVARRPVTATVRSEERIVEIGPEGRTITL